MSVECAGYRLAKKYFAGIEVFRRIPLLSNEKRHPSEAEEGCQGRHTQLKLIARSLLASDTHNRMATLLCTRISNF